LSSPVVDFHSHYVDPEIVPVPPAGTSTGLASCWPTLTSWEVQLEGLGARGVDRRVVSSPHATLAGPGRTLRAETIRAVNDSLARRAVADGDRIHALATIDAFSGENAAAEVSRAVTELGLAGICVDCCRGDWLLDAPQARPALQTAAALGVPVFVHPVGPPSPDRRYERLAAPGRLLARGSEAALCLLAVIRSALLDELSGLRLVVPMIALPGLYYAGESPRARLFVDTMGLSAAWVRLAVDLVGVRQVVVGTDYPIATADPSREPVEAMLRETGLGEPELCSISSASALALLAR
jgi:hypothetical protein